MHADFAWRAHFYFSYIVSYIYFNECFFSKKAEI